MKLFTIAHCITAQKAFFSSNLMSLATTLKAVYFIVAILITSITGAIGCRTQT
jgi:hypothetical protein